MRRRALDTSAAVPYLLRSHQSHGSVRKALRGVQLALTGHSLAETYSVLTRLPGDARLTPSDAVHLLERNFDQPVICSVETAKSLATQLASLGIAGGAVYDALVGLAARDADLELTTRDRRAATTYSALGIAFTLLPA